jgi:hypothetical protein
VEGALPGELLGNREEDRLPLVGCVRTDVRDAVVDRPNALIHGDPRTIDVPQVVGIGTFREELIADICANGVGDEAVSDGSTDIPVVPVGSQNPIVRGITGVSATR